LLVTPVRDRDLMKKGLRPDHACVVRAHQRSRSRPDEEGIKTLDRRALRPVKCSRSRPDEEGIKTHPVVHAWGFAFVRDRDLMKKGLRPGRRSRVIVWRGSRSRPDEEGIKTSRARGPPQAGRSRSRPDEEGIKTTSLSHKWRNMSSRSRPDEEGIKTLCAGRDARRVPFEIAT